MTRLNNTIENAFVAWVKSVLGSSFTVMWDKQDIERPSLPYITLNLITAENDEPINAPDQSYKTTDTFTYIFKKSLTLSINIYDELDGEYLLKLGQLKSSRFNPLVKTSFKTAGLTLQKCGNIVDISALIDTEYERRANCDFFFGYTISEDIETGEINRGSGEVIGTDFDTNNEI